MAVRNEMTVKQLKDILEHLPDDTQVYVCCEGYTNYTTENPSTYTTINGKGLFISDEKAVDLGNGEML
jgi:hypothetical protein